MTSMRGGANGVTCVRGVAAAIALTLAAPSVASAGSVASSLLLVKKKKRKKKKRKKKKPRLTPEMARERRAPVQAQARQRLDAGDSAGATTLYDDAAHSTGDPILFMDAGDAYLSIAVEDRDAAAAETARHRAQTAQDILYFHLDSASDPDNRPVTVEQTGRLLARAGTIIDDADALVAELEAEREAELAAAQEATPPSTRARGDGRALRVSGIGLMTLGVVGLGVGVTGLVLGSLSQTQADDPTVYGRDFDLVDMQGRRNNMIATVGLVAGGVAVAAGLPLYFVGRHRRRAAGGRRDRAHHDSSGDGPTVAVVPTGRGLAVTGRF